MVSKLRALNRSHSAWHSLRDYRSTDIFLYNLTTCMGAVMFDIRVDKVATILLWDTLCFECVILLYRQRG